MPRTTGKALVILHGTDAYARFLDRLAKVVQEKSGTRPFDSRRDLVEHAVARLAFEHGLIAPRRMPPSGGVRTGAGRPPKDGRKKSRENSEIRG